MSPEGFPRAPLRETLIGCQRQRRATDDDDDDDEMVSAAGATEQPPFDSNVMSATGAPAGPLTSFNEACELITCTSRRNLVGRCLGGLRRPRGHCLPAGTIVSSALLTWSTASWQRAPRRLLYENCMTKPADCGNWLSSQRTTNMVSWYWFRCRLTDITSFYRCFMNMYSGRQPFLGRTINTAILVLTVNFPSDFTVRRQNHSFNLFRSSCMAFALYNLLPQATKCAKCSRAIRVFFFLMIRLTFAASFVSCLLVSYFVIPRYIQQVTAAPMISSYCLRGIEKVNIRNVSSYDFL